jgi:hypothetical protein
MMTLFGDGKYPAALSCSPGRNATYSGLTLPEGSVPKWLAWLEELGIGLPLISDMTRASTTMWVQRLSHIFQHTHLLIWKYACASYTVSYLPASDVSPCQNVTRCLNFRCIWEPHSAEMLGSPARTGSLALAHSDFNAY